MSTSKRKVLTLDERLEVINRLEKGHSCRKIADELKVGKTQIQSIRKRKLEFIEDFENNISGARKRRCSGLTENCDINELTWKWFQDARTRNINISGPLIQERAQHFAKELGKPSFAASNGWLECFLKRNNIVFKSLTGERADVDSSTVTDWKLKLPRLCEGYSPENIWNMDETGLFFKDSTKKSYVVKGDDCAGGKRSKERVTVALCSSMTGEKFKPLVIGRSAQPRCFNKLKPSALPLIYKNSRKSWMNSKIFEDWLRLFDRKMKSQNRKALLFIDNAPSHPTIALPNVKLQFFPANTTSRLQPMDQGIIQTLKLKYRKRQLRHVLNQLDKSGKCGSQLLKEINVLNAIYWVNSSWKDVKAETIQKCFEHCGFSMQDSVHVDDISVDGESDESENDDDDDVPLSVLKLSNELFGCSFNELADLDKNLATTDTQTIDWSLNAGDLLETLREPEVVDSDVDDDIEDSDELDNRVITCAEATECIDKLKTFALSKGNSAIMHHLVDIEEHVISISLDRKQTKILDFFKVK